MGGPRTHILIGFAEALPAPEVFFSLYDAGCRVSAFTRAGARTPLARHLPLTGVHEIPAPERDSRAAAAVSAIMNGPNAPDFVLPIDDAALWLVDRALSGAPDRVIGAAGAQARLALDKTLQIAAAGKAGLHVPATVIVRRPADMDAPLPFPAIAKPALAIAEKDGRIGKDAVAYLPDEAAARAFADTLGDDMAPLLVQPLIAERGEGVFGFAAQGEVTHWSGHRRLRMMNPHGSGSSACESMAPDPDIRAAVERFMLDAGWRGPFMIELLRDADGTPWFMELNGRMWGSMALARAQGLEYPAWAAALAADPGFRPPRTTAPPPPGSRRNIWGGICCICFSSCAARAIRSTSPTGPNSDKAFAPFFGAGPTAAITPIPPFRAFFGRMSSIPCAARCAARDNGDESCTSRPFDLVL